MCHVENLNSVPVPTLVLDMLDAEAVQKGMGGRSTYPREGASSHKVVKVCPDLACNLAPAELPGVRCLHWCNRGSSETWGRGEGGWSHALGHAQRGTMPAR